jgi:hypothetical protein
MSTKYEDAISVANTILDNPYLHGEPDVILARQFLAQHEEMQSITWAIRTVIADITSEDGARAYEEAWAALKRATGMKVES